MTFVFVILGIAFVIFLINSGNNGKPIIKINKEEDTEMQFFYFSMFDNERATHFIRENFIVTVSASKIIVKNSNRTDVYKIQSSGNKNGYLYFFCMNDNNIRNRIYFRKDGLMIIFDDFESEKGIALSQEDKPIFN